MAAMDAAPRGTLDIGRVIQEAFAVLGRNFPTYAILALILTSLPAAVAAYLQQEAWGPSDSTTSALTKFLAGLAPLVTGAVLQGALTYATIVDLNGRRSSIAESLAVGLRAFLPLIAIGILLIIAVAVGLILLVAPGVMLMVVWVVVTPAYVAERRGIAEAFARSAELTRGSRWSIFGLLVLYGVLVTVGALAIGALTGSLTAFSNDSGSLVRTVLISPLYSGFTALFAATGTAVIYVELRRLREGASPEHLAAIFD